MHNNNGPQGGAGQFGYAANGDAQAQFAEGSLPSVNSMFPELHFAYGAKVFHEEPEPEPEVVLKPQNCIREQQWSQIVIDRYLERNKEQLYECNRCNIYFPSPEYLSGHMAHHRASDERGQNCDSCPQRFYSPYHLQSHRQMHSSDPATSRVCSQCNGHFRSGLALRKHKMNCNACYEYPFGVKPQLMVSPREPLDHFGFITSDAEDETEEENDVLSAIPLSDALKERQKTSDSGLGSDSSNHSLTTSPARSSHLEDDYDPATTFGVTRPPKDDDEESGFRSRMNSHSTHSLSPSSSSTFSTSPIRQSSSLGPVYTSHGHQHGHNNNLHHPYRQNPIRRDYGNSQQQPQQRYDHRHQTITMMTSSQAQGNVWQSVESCEAGYVSGALGSLDGYAPNSATSVPCHAFASGQVGVPAGHGGVDQPLRSAVLLN